MSSRISEASLNRQPDYGAWSSVAPYIVPPMAASIAIVPVFRNMVAKSALQRGQTPPSISFTAGMQAGFKAMPTVGVIVGAQMVFQSSVLSMLPGSSADKHWASTLASSAIVGLASAPILAVFNGQTMGRSAAQSLRNFSLKQGLTICMQETAFVAGLSFAAPVSAAMRKQFGDSKIVDYTAAFLTGVTGSLAGHPANTILTRSQSGMKIDRYNQLMRGSLRRAWAVGVFSVIYKASIETLQP